MSAHSMILQLVEQGKLTSEQGTALLKQLELYREINQIRQEKKVNFIRAVLEDPVKGRVLDEIKIPVELVKLGLKLGRKVWAGTLEKYPDLKQFKVNFWSIHSRIEKDQPGRVTDLISRDGTRRLQIWLE